MRGLPLFAVLIGLATGLMIAAALALHFLRHLIGG